MEENNRKPTVKNVRPGIRFSVDKWYGGYGEGVILVQKVHLSHPSEPAEWAEVTYTYFGSDNRMTGGTEGMISFVKALEGVNGKVHWTVGA